MKVEGKMSNDYHPNKNLGLFVKEYEERVKPLLDSGKRLGWDAEMALQGFLLEGMGSNIGKINNGEILGRYISIEFNLKDIFREGIPSGKMSDEKYEENVAKVDRRFAEIDFMLQKDPNYLEGKGEIAK
jgi:hypothetical protein